MQDIAEAFWLLDVRHVAGLLEDHPLRARDPLVDGPDDQRGRLVITSGDEQGGDVDPMELIGDVPVLQ